VSDLVVIGSCAGKFYVLDRQTGALHWSYDIQQDGKQISFHGDPLVVDTTVIIGTDHSCAPDGIGHVYAFDAKNSTVRWKRKFKGIYTPVVLSGKEIIFGSVADEWYKAELATGVPVWRYQVKMDSPSCGSPRAVVVLEDKVYFVGQDSAIYVLESASGKLSKRIVPPSPPSTALTTYRQQIVFGAEDGRLYSLDPATTKFKAILRWEGKPTGKLQLDGDTLYLFIDGPDKQGQLASVDLATNTLRWTQAAERQWASDKPQLWRGQVLAGNCGGKVSAFAAKDGLELWSTQFQGCVRSIGLSNDLLYIGAQEGMLYAFAPAGTQ